MNRDRIMQLLGLTVGMALAAPVANVPAAGDDSPTATIEVELRGENPIVSISDRDGQADPELEETLLPDSEPRSREK